MATPSQLSQSAVFYSYDLDRFKRVVVYLLAANANLLGMTPKELSAAAKCYCYDDEVFKKVVVYLLSNITGGGGSVDACLVAQSGAPVAPCAFAFGLAYDNDPNSPTAGSFWFWDATGAAWVRFSV